MPTQCIHLSLTLFLWCSSIGAAVIPSFEELVCPEQIPLVVLRQDTVQYDLQIPLVVLRQDTVQYDLLIPLCVLRQDTAQSDLLRP